MSDINTEKKLYLIPTPIVKSNKNFVLPEHTLNIVKKLNCFIVEKVQTAQNFLQWIDHSTPLHEITLRVLNKKTPEHEILSFLNLVKNQSVGLMSEAGAPGVADPGATFIRFAHGKGIQVVPLVGPSSILLALMASGLNGQNFSFHGYLPRDENKRRKKIQELERDSLKTGFTHIFMETPHRNNSLFSLLFDALRSSTNLCIAANLTAENEIIKTMEVDAWKKSALIDLQKIPALFLINSK